MSTSTSAGKATDKATSVPKVNGDVDLKWSPHDVATNFNFPKEEEKVLSYWKEIDAFRTSLEQSKGKPIFNFYDGEFVYHNVNPFHLQNMLWNRSTFCDWSAPLWSFTHGKLSSTLHYKHSDNVSAYRVSPLQVLWNQHCVSNTGIH